MTKYDLTADWSEYQASYPTPVATNALSTITTTTAGGNINDIVVVMVLVLVLVIVLVRLHQYHQVWNVKFILSLLGQVTSQML